MQFALSVCGDWLINKVNIRSVTSRSKHAFRDS
jgi:hypothetical protein